jgi:hypothetical protein
MRNGISDWRAFKEPMLFSDFLKKLTNEELTSMNLKCLFAGLIGIFGQRSINQTNSTAGHDQIVTEIAFVSSLYRLAASRLTHCTIK